MARSLRLIDNESGIVEVSSRTVHGRFLMRPSREVNQLILGVLGRAQAKYGVEIFAFIFLSNHFHLLMRVLSALVMANFMSYLKGNIAKELGHLHGWKEKFWGRRYHSASVADSDEALMDRFMYILRNGCKENLVASPLEWAGVSSAPALYRGETTIDGGIWYDRTAQYKARRRGEGLKLSPSRETVELSPLPFLENLTPAQQQRFMIDAVESVERETRARHEKEGTSPLGVARILKQHPHDKPAKFRRSPAPLFLTATRAEYRAMRAARTLKVEAYRRAVERMKCGELNVRFPQGTFPPPQPFVPLAGAENRAPPSLPP